MTDESSVRSLTHLRIYFVVKRFLFPSFFNDISFNDYVMYMFFFTNFCCLKFDSWSVHPCTNVSMFHQIRFTHIELIPKANQRVASQDLDDVTGAFPIPLPVAGPFLRSGAVKPRNAFQQHCHTHYICTWNNFETRMELQIAKVSLKWRYI